ncbi:MAG: DNA repair exonuclease [Candidatus Bathyarchaeota archaeon]
MNPFSFIHAADLHLGYSQYALETRREDFQNAFGELIEKSIELKPDFLILAGDLFHHARPSNITLENAIKSFRQLRDIGIPVLTVDGSHDSEPNMLTGTILNPLDSAGLIYHLPRHKGACWRKKNCCYVYGVPNFRTRRKTEEFLPAFMKDSKPKPVPNLFNIFAFHMALDDPLITPSYVEAEATPELIPDNFNYYAAGHLHAPYVGKFKTGTLVYSGSTETVNYAEARNKSKGFYQVEVDQDGEISLQFMNLDSPRKFMILEQDFTGINPPKIIDQAVQLVKGVDEEGIVIVPVLKGLLPPEAKRSDLRMTKLRNAAKKALLVHPIMQLRETEVPVETVRSIFETEFKDMKTKAFEYFLQIFSKRYTQEEAENIADVAVKLVEFSTEKEDEKIRKILKRFVE